MCKRTCTTHKDGIYQSKLNERVTEKQQVLYRETVSLASGISLISGTVCNTQPLVKAM